MLVPYSFGELDLRFFDGRYYFPRELTFKFTDERLGNNEDYTSPFLETRAVSKRIVVYFQKTNKQRTAKEQRKV